MKLHFQDITYLKDLQLNIQQNVKSKPLMEIIDTILKMDEKTNQKAVSALTKLSENKTKEGFYAWLLLGYCYEAGIGVKRDPKRAFEIYHKPEIFNLPEGKTRIGNCYQFGEGTKKDMDKAIEHYELANDEHDGIATCFLGYIYDSGFTKNNAGQNLYDPQTALRYFKRSAELGCNFGRFHLAVYHLQGKHTDQSYSLAKENYLKAAEGGHGEAQWMMGLLHREGDHIRQDNYLAFQYLQNAIVNGSTNAICDLAICHLRGIGTPVDPKCAFELFQQAVKEGVDIAKFYLAQFYESGEVVGKIDIKQAAELYSQVAAYLNSEKTKNTIKYHYYSYYLPQEKCADIFNKMGRFFFKHEELSKDTAKEYLKIAHDLGNTESTIFLAEHFADKIGDLEQSVEYYEAAAAQGCKESSLRLGHHYLIQATRIKKSNRSNIQDPKFKLALGNALLFYYRAGKDVLAEESKKVMLQVKA